MMPAGRRSPAFLTRDRLLAWANVLLLVESASLLIKALEQHGVFGPVPPISIDFVSFYAAGKLVLAGTPALAYDQAVHLLTEHQVTGANTPYMMFAYPPVFLFLCAAFATLPYLVAYAVYQLVTLALFVHVLRRILAASGWAWITPVLAFPACFWAFASGQNTFLNTALLAGFTLLVDRRPIAAGALLGALCFKPHLGLLAPVALLAGRRWQAFAAAASVVCGLAMLSAWVFGADTWRAFFSIARASEAGYAGGIVKFAIFISPFGTLRHMGAGIPTAYAAQAAITAAMAAFVALVWWRCPSPALRAACLLSATLLAVPLLLHYDQVLAVAAAAWLVRDAQTTPLRAWEKAILAACYPVALLAPLIALVSPVSLTILVSIAIAGLSARRAWASTQHYNSLK